MAQKVVSTLTDLYLSEHARLYRTPGTLEFLETETNRVRDELARNEEQLRDLRKNTGLASTETQRTVLVERIAKLEEELLTTEASLASGTAEARLLRESFDGLDKIQVTGNGSTLASTAADDVRRQLYNLQLREQQLLSRSTENHVEVIEVRREIAGAQALLRRQDAPAESAQESLVRREPILQALRSKAGAVQGQLDAARVELASFSENEYTIAKLQREIDLLDANYRKYSDNLEQARIDHSLESRRMSNINVVQPASFNPRPDSPQKALLLVFGLAFAVAPSVGVSALRELLDHSLKTPEEIERKLDLPTLVAIPRISEGSFILSGRN